MVFASVFNVLIAAASVVTAASATPSADTHDTLPYASEVTAVQPSSNYVVKLDCLGCPFAFRDSSLNISSLDRNRGNFLLLDIALDESKKALVLNGRRILPLDPMPLYINAPQIPSDLPNLLKDMLADRSNEAWSQTVNFPLLYEHSLLKNETTKQWRVQFDVKGLAGIELAAPEESFQPVTLDKEGQKLVEILLNIEQETSILSIESVGVVDREHRVRPFKMKCGRLAMVQTAFDPSAWDEYGELGTWSRTWNLAIGKLGALQSDNIQQALLLSPIAVLVALGIIAARRWYYQRRVNSDGTDEEDEIALLEAYYGDAPPEYADVPAIKIEEYD